MILRIISPQKIETHTIAWVELYTPVGNFVIQPGHAPMIVTLAAHQPVTFRLKTGKQGSVTPRTGVAEITRTQATILINE